LPDSSPPGAKPEIAFSALEVFVRGLAIEAEIGVYRHERGRPQPLLVDVEVTLAPAPIGALSETVNYETLAAAARALAAEGHIDLVETYAQRLAAACLADPRVLSARVRVEKPLALQGALAAGVEVIARRA
jgi:dihydroneopterin aldolase